VACHFAEEVKAGAIAAAERAPMFDPGIQPPAWEPPPT